MTGMREIAHPRLATGRPKACTSSTEVEWNAAKSQACFDERGFDFAYAAQAFSDPARTIEIDGRRDCGEERYRLTGVVEGRLDVVVYTPRHAMALGRIDEARVDATTEADIARHIAEDEAQAMQDAAQYARRIRSRLGLSQAEFSRRINVLLETVRNWVQGKRSPSGAAKALLKVLDRAPEAALAALH